MQVNTNLSLLAIDDFVTRDMVAEMFNILGFHLPNTTQYISDIQEPHRYFDPRLYCSELSSEDLEKVTKFTNKQVTVENITSISFTPGDVRAIIRYEDANSQLKNWSTLLPSVDKEKFDMIPNPTYYDCLLFSWLLKGSNLKNYDRLERLIELCNVGWHLRIPDRRSSLSY